MFHFDMKSNMREMFGGVGHEATEVRLLAQKVSSNLVFFALSPFSFRSVSDVLVQLSTVVATLGEKPMIRYSSAHPASKSLAMALLEQVGSLPVRDSPSVFFFLSRPCSRSPSSQVKSEQRSTVLILDRTLDLVSPVRSRLRPSFCPLRPSSAVPSP